jgi:hypothetical protein
MDSTFGVQQAYTVLDDVDLEEGSGESAGLLPDEEVAHGGADLDDGDRCSHTGGGVLEFVQFVQDEDEEDDADSCVGKAKKMAQ